MALLLEWERGWQRGEQSKARCPVAALQTGSGFAVQVLYTSSWVLVRRTFWQPGNCTFCHVICLLGSVLPLTVPCGLRRIESAGSAGSLPQQAALGREQIFHQTSCRGFLLATESWPSVQCLTVQ